MKIEWPLEENTTSWGYSNNWRIVDHAISGRIASTPPNVKKKQPMPKLWKSWPLPSTVLGRRDTSESSTWAALRTGRSSIHVGKLTSRDKQQLTSQHSQTVGDYVAVHWFVWYCTTQLLLPQSPRVDAHMVGMNAQRIDPSKQGALKMSLASKSNFLKCPLLAKLIFEMSLASKSNFWKMFLANQSEYYHYGWNWDGRPTTLKYL